SSSRLSRPSMICSLGTLRINLMTLARCLWPGGPRCVPSYGTLWHKSALRWRYSFRTTHIS
ncbi:COP9 signalosome complex subunit 8, partial [Podarcis lilfordi]